MPVYSQNSIDKLATCHPDLIKIFNEVIQHTDCTIIEGKRSLEKQREYFRTGNSHLDPDDPDMFKKCKHLQEPSLAVDVLPCPIDWQDNPRNSWFAGFVMATARRFGIDLIWGGNWDADITVVNKTANFFDAPHFQLKD